MLSFIPVVQAFQPDDIRQFQRQAQKPELRRASSGTAKDSKQSER